MTPAAWGTVDLIRSLPVTMHHKLLRCAWLAILAVASACSPRTEPELPPQTYREAVTAFYVGLSAMQTTQEVLAKERLERAVALVPQEPAVWANLGLLLLRQQDLDRAAEHLTRAANLAPESAAIQRLQALADSRRGNLPQAIAHWKRAIELDPRDRLAEYSLALETERQGGAANDKEAQAILERLLARGDNLAARIEYVRLAAKRGDAAALSTGITPLDGPSRSWSPTAQDQLKQLVASPTGDQRATTTRVAFLKNVLLREPAYRAALAEVATPAAEVGQPVARFLRLKNPDPHPAPADQTLAFTVKPAADAPSSSWAGDAMLDDGGNPVVVSAGAAGVRIAGSAAVACQAWRDAAPDAVAVADLDYDFRQDLALAGTAGLCLLRNEGSGRFADVTAASKLPAALLSSAAQGIWPADIDTDGDLDLVVALRDAAPIALRNNSDGTFARRDLPLPAIRARGFAWADLDGEGVPDAAFVDDTGAVHVLINLRGGAFRAERIEHGARAVAIAALANDVEAPFDLLALAPDGGIARVARNRRNQSWATSAVGRVELTAASTAGAARLLIADLDNNGAFDVIATGADTTRVLLGGPGGAFAPMGSAIPLAVRGIADLDGDGRLEMIGLAQGRPVRASSTGSRSYKWTVLRPRAATATGDQRINAFGIGGAIELRAGLHLQRLPIVSPIVHFGLGDAEGAEIARITWPNGVLQAEFDTKAGQTLKASQRLKGSCPWLFTWNGREMVFVTDLIWRSPLGLRLNAVETADTLMTEDWVKIRGDLLAPRGGAYDLRITAELWETHFFDLTGLLAVDHPAGTEIFVDERFAVPPPPLSIVATGPVQPFAAVRDDRGTDVAPLADAVDSRFLDFAGRGAYQGITRPHFVEMELPETAPRTGPLWLVARGWVHPTDSSVNVAIAQGAHPGPDSLSLHVADGSGRFHEVKRGLGFPAGKDKTILIDLSGVFGRTGTRRLRLATNLEIFWDRLGWAIGRPEAAVKTQRLPLQRADLSPRGYSIVEQRSPSVPERPAYRLDGTGQRWRDLEGYYTRFGDVTPLLTAVDDRYVIMNAGDEIRLRFPEVPPPAAGLVRDFVLMGDGWVKDGDYNTGFSRTVLPLPTHADGRYATPPHQLEDDPLYRQHKADFAEYHTRYVSADRVRDALQPIPRH
jgi:tetratricopeptide (TPR) repeat protein